MWLPISHVSWSCENLDSLFFLFLPSFFEWLRSLDFQSSLVEQNIHNFYFFLLNRMDTLFSSLLRYFISPNHKTLKKIFRLLFFRFCHRQEKTYFLVHACGVKWIWFLFLFIEQNGDIVSNSSKVWYFISPGKLSEKVKHSYCSEGKFRILVWRANLIWH